MKIIEIGGSGLFCLIVTAGLLGACKEPSSSAPSQALTLAEKTTYERHCCQRAGRNNNH